MRLQAAFSKRHLLVLLLFCSLVMSFLGLGVARPLRRAMAFVLAPLGDAPMYAKTKFGAKLRRDSAEPMTVDEARKLRAENAFLRKVSAY